MALRTRLEVRDDCRVDPAPHSETSDVKSWTVIRGAGDALPSGALSPIWSDDSFSVSIVDAEDSAAQTVVITFDDLARFTLSFDDREILIASFGDVAEMTIEHLLFDQIWPRIIAHDGRLVLHGAAVATSTGAIIIVGQSGTGKSTLAASLHQRGFALLGDDAIIISMIDGIAYCRAVYPSLRLYADSIDALFDERVAQSEMAHYSDKRNVHLTAAAGGDEQPIRAIFFIDRDDECPFPAVTSLSPAEACMRLVEHSFWLDPTDLNLTAEKLRAAGALASSIPSCQLSYKRDYAGLCDVQAAMLAAID